MIQTYQHFLRDVVCDPDSLRGYSGHTCHSLIFGKYRHNIEAVYPPGEQLNKYLIHGTWD